MNFLMQIFPLSLVKQLFLIFIFFYCEACEAKHGWQDGSSSSSQVGSLQTISRGVVGH